MIANNFSKSEGDFDVLCNVVLMLPVEYDVVTEVTDVKEECVAEEMAEHKPICCYMMTNDRVE